MKTAITSAIATVIAITGCTVPVRVGDNAHRVFHGSLNFTQEERTSIESAMDRMREQTSGAVQYDVVWDGEGNAFNTLNVFEVAPDGYDMHTMGHAGGNSGHVDIFFVRTEMKSITSEPYANVVRYVALHEMTHAVGVYEHLKQGLMTTIATLPLLQCIDNVTMVELQKHVSIPEPIPCDIPATPSP